MYNPGVNDISGQLLGQGIMTGAQGILSGLELGRERQQQADKEAKEEAKRFDHTFNFGKSIGLWGDEAKSRSTDELLGTLSGMKEKKSQQMQQESHLLRQLLGNAQVDQILANITRGERSDVRADKEQGLKEQGLNLQKLQTEATIANVDNTIKNRDAATTIARDKLDWQMGQSGAELKFTTDPKTGATVATFGNNMQVLPDRPMQDSGFKPFVAEDGSKVPGAYIDPKGRVVDLRDKQDPLTQLLMMRLLPEGGTAPPASSGGGVMERFKQWRSQGQ